MVQCFFIIQKIVSDIFSLGCGIAPASPPATFDLDLDLLVFRVALAVALIGLLSSAWPLRLLC